MSYWEGEPVRPWLFAIARNQRFGHCRRQRRKLELLGDLEAQPCAEPSCDNTLCSGRLRALSGSRWAFTSLRFRLRAPFNRVRNNDVRRGRAAEMLSHAALRW